MFPIVMLANDDVIAIADDALSLLERVGIAVRDAEARALLLDHGARLDGADRLRFPADLVRRAVATAPSVVRLFDTRGALTHTIGAGPQYFTPGSSAVSVLDRNGAAARAPTTADYVEYVQVVGGLPHFASQSTAFIPVDVPVAVSDSYRLYLSLLLGEKPVVTGTFSAASLPVMRDLQIAVRGSAADLEARPLAMWVWPQPNKVKGKALLSRASSRIEPQTSRGSPSRSPLILRNSHMPAAAIVSRSQT